MSRNLKFCNDIRNRRLELGLTQEDLALLVGSTQNTISSIETGKYSPSAYLSGLLCEALDCKWEDLFYYRWSCPEVAICSSTEL